MAYWLIKSEPSAYSWDQLVKEKRTSWTGVRNPQASLNLKAMKAGDRCFFYHSGEEHAVVGTVTVLREAHPDTTDSTGAWECVDIAADQKLPDPVTLDAIKAAPRLADMVLVKNSRLSVQPVTEDEWIEVCRMGGLDEPPR